MNRESEAVRTAITDHRSLITSNAAVAAAAAALTTVVFCLLLLAHDPLLFWNDDYEISILPVCADMARAWSHGEFPLLSPYSWVCGNLAGEFQYGVFSIFVNALIILVWKLPLIFSQQAAALSIAHLAVLSAGAFLLARDRLTNDPAQGGQARGLLSPGERIKGTTLSRGNALSLFVALIAALNGWIICWGASDWLGALGAFAWLPWAWWAAERALDVRRTRWRFLWPAPFVYLLVTGGFPYTVLMLALVLAWLTLREIVSSRELTRIIPLAGGVVLGLGLAAPAWLALLDYVQGSARAVQGAEAHYQWLVPWKAWPGLILPAWTVRWPDFSSRLTPHTATELACGFMPAAAIVAALVAIPREFLRKMMWELALLIIVGAFAMVPTAGVFRWSFRWLPLFLLVLALCAAEALALFSREADTTNQRQKKSIVALMMPAPPPSLALLLLIAVMLAAKEFGFEGEYLFPLGWIFFALALSWSILEHAGARWLREWLPPAMVFAALLATYFCIPPNCGVPKYNFAQSLLQPQPLDPHRLYLSFYPPPESAYRLEVHSEPVGQTLRPGSTPMWAGLRFINGYSPIRPAGVAREFATSIHGEIDPHMGEWLTWHEAQPDGLLERLGVDGIVVARELGFAPLPASEWHRVVANEEGSVYHRNRIPTVRSIDWDGKHAHARVSSINEARNSVSAEVSQADRPALIAFSRPFFRGYRASIEHRKLPVSTFRNLLPLVEVPAGVSGRLVLAYRPNWLIYGGALALASAVVWIVSAIFAFVQTSRTALKS